MVLDVTCPAKLNLFLAVGPKDEVGYHPIRTVFQAIGLLDEVRIEIGREPQVSFEGGGIPENNTVTKALRLLSEFADLPAMAIRIKKIIPLQAGLGGGSANAAAVIRAVRHLVPERITETDAFSVAQAVGADVPYFLVGGRAYAEGYGEKLQALPDPDPTWAVVVKPPYGYSTAEMYAALDLQGYPFKEFRGEFGYNDFERNACETTDVAERLGVFGARPFGMTGSGSAVYGLFPSEEAAKTACERAKSEQLGDAWSVPLLTRKESLQIRTTEF